MNHSDPTYRERLTKVPNFVPLYGNSYKIGAEVIEDTKPAGFDERIRAHQHPIRPGFRGVRLVRGVQYEVFLADDVRWFIGAATRTVIDTRWSHDARRRF